MEQEKKTIKVALRENKTATADKAPYLMTVILGLLGAVAAMAAPSAPRGTEWQDCRTFGEGRLPPRAWFGHFPDEESAKAVRPERSPWQISLDSETAWRFRWSRRPEERPVGFFRPDYDVSGWDVVKVPCSWQAMGIRASGERFGVPIYVNQPYIFTPRFPANADCPPRVVGNDLPADWTFGSKDNPIGSYRRDFELPSDWAGSQVVIRFDGVESFYYLWVNGHYLGFAKNSRGASEFDVTDVVRPGTNTVALEVYRNSDGSYLECQDIYRLSGILRSVSVHRRPKTHLEDVRLLTRPWTPGVYDGDWTLELDVTKTGPDAVEVGAKVFDATGGKVPFEGDVRLGRSVLRFARPQTWTAETPNLHTLVVTLARDGKVFEAAGFDLGFREVSIRDDGVQSNRVFTVNGRPVKLKGVNRGETDPMYGHYVPDSRIEEDLRLIKEGNFNHIRCSHMPQPPYFYYLCNRYGIYVMDEANLESHGLYYGKESLSNRPEWKEAHVDRQRAMYGWNKNFPCIVYWSLGNEAGPGDNFKACAEYLRTVDGTRPVQYERNNWVGDSGACMYPSLELVARFASAAADRRDPISPDRPIRYPYYLLEYAHSFNNSCGNLADYQALIESSDRMLGGAIWDWADQSLWKRTPDGRIVQAWGGCFGEKPEEGQGIMDGIVTTDRRPEPNYYEAKHVFQNFTATLADGKIRIRNKNYFRDSSGYDCRWMLLVNGEAAGTGTLAVSVGPQESVDIPLPEAVRAAVGKGADEVALRVRFALRNAETVLPKGWVVAEDQLELVPPRKPDPLCTDGERPAVVRDDAETLSIRSGELAYAFSKATGELVSLRRGTHELLKSPVALDCFRVPVGGESHCFRTNTFGLARLRDGLRNMKPTLKSLSAVRKESDGTLSLTCVVSYRGTRKEDAPWYCHGDGGKIADCGPVDADAPGVETTSAWRFCGAKGVALRTTFRPFGRPTEFSRVGWRFVFDEPETDVRYFALGPHDNYPDRRTCCFAAVHSAVSTAFGFRYGVNQDNGTRGEARWVELEKPGVRFDAAGDRLFSFAVTPHSPTELMENAHPELNPPPVKTELGFYAKVRGLGSGNCGPVPLPRDRIAAGETCVLDVNIRSASVLSRNDK